MQDGATMKTGGLGRSDIRIGRITYGYEGINIQQWGEGASLTIGSFCSIAVGLRVMLGGNHRVDWATTFPFGHFFNDELVADATPGHPQTRGDVVIGNDVWIGQNATILSGLRIGHGAVIATNATVTKVVGDYEIWGGNPARHIRTRFTPEVREALLDLAWWDLDVTIIRALEPLLSRPPRLEILNEIRAAIRMFGQPARPATEPREDAA